MPVAKNQSTQCVERTIWMLWMDGLDAAPFVVQQCVASWIAKNPTWQVIVLDKDTLAEHVNLDELCGENAEYISIQALSDIIRINLLVKHGGVWVDATCFCNKPLDEWLPAYMDHGFFAFRDPGPDRPISSWFIATTKDSATAQLYGEKVNRFWKTRVYKNQKNVVGWFARRFLQSRLQESPHGSSRFKRLSSAMSKLRVYPYFWFHYHFSFVLMSDRLFATQWDMGPGMTAEQPHRLAEFGLFRQLSDQMKQEIDSKVAPLYKLRWNYPEERYVAGCALKYLLESKHQDRSS